MFFNHDALRAAGPIAVPGLSDTASTSCASVGRHTKAGAYTEALVANGGTEVRQPLEYLYDGASQTPDAVNVVMVISDGLTRPHGLEELRRRQRASEAFTVVNWLGSFDQNSLLGKLSNYDVVGRPPGTPYSKVFFNQVRRQLNSHLVVKTRSCG